MKTSILIVLAICVSLMASAQEDDGFKNNNGEIKTLFSGEHSHGGYGAFAIRYNEIDSKEGMSIGGRFGWIIDHNVAIGLGGRGFFTESDYYDIPGQLTDEYNIGGGYGGFYIEPIIGARYPVHISVPIFMGAGGVGFTRKFYDDWDNDDNWDESNLVDGDAFFFVEPGVELEINLIRFIRVAFGAYYRVTTDVRLEDDFGNKLVDNDIMNGLSFGMTFKFGKF